MIRTTILLLGGRSKMTSRKFAHFWPPPPLTHTVTKFYPMVGGGGGGGGGGDPRVTSQFFCFIFFSVILQFFCALLLTALSSVGLFSSVDPMQHCILLARHPFFCQGTPSPKQSNTFVQLAFVHHYTKTNTQ